MKSKLTSRFVRSEHGSLSIEAVLVVPILAWAITATFVFFDAFKTQYISQRATYTIADMLSREETPVDAPYLASLHEMYDYLSNGDGANTLRVTVVERKTDEDTGEPYLDLVWSEGVNVQKYVNLSVIEDRIPNISVGEQLIVVESEQEWSPAFGVGLADYKFYEIALARPRFSPKLCWETTAGCTTPPVGSPGGSADDGDPDLGGGTG